MAASVTEIRQLVVASDNAHQTPDEITATAVYMVVYDGVDYLTVGALEASGPDPDGGTITIPGMGEELPGVTPTLAVNDRDAQRDPDNPHITRVTVNYSSDYDVYPQPSSSSAGSKWNIDIESEGVVFTETVTHDRNGKPIRNSAGDFYDPPLMKEFYDERLVISFTTDTLDMAVAQAARGRINSDEVTLTIKGQTRTFGAQCLKLADFSYRTTLAGGATAYAVKMALLHRAPRTIGETTYPGWQRLVPDQGFYRMASDSSGGGAEPERIADTNGEGVVTPVYLDGAGQPLDRTSDVNVVLLPFDIDELANFADLFQGLGEE